MLHSAVNPEQAHNRVPSQQYFCIVEEKGTEISFITEKDKQAEAQN